MIRVRRQRDRRVCQGDIFRDVDYIEGVAERNGVLEVLKIRFPLVIVLTQDCDFKQDYRVRWSRQNTSNEDKMLVSVLVAPLYNVEHVYTGEHLEELGMKMRTINKKRTAKQNRSGPQKLDRRRGGVRERWGGRGGSPGGCRWLVGAWGVLS